MRSRPQTPRYQAVPGRTGDRKTVQNLLRTGHAFDIEKGGYFDAHSGCVNFWCGPDDKPACWDVPIDKGAFDEPRSFVGILDWEWDDKVETCTFRLEASPYDLPISRLNETQWEQIFAWLRQKADELFRLADIQPGRKGIPCPFCKEFTLYPDEMLNGLIDHVAENHKDVKIKSVSLGSPTVLQTDQGNFPLQEAL